MKFDDWAACGATSNVYTSVSRAKSQLDILTGRFNEFRRENGKVSDKSDDAKHAREFQRWAEELIYQFNKIVRSISDSPENPLHDAIDLASFLNLIEESKLDTSLISGLENKEKFEHTLQRAQLLFKELQNVPAIRDHIYQQEQSRLERERLRAQEEARVKLEAETLSRKEIERIRQIARVTWMVKIMSDRLMDVNARDKDGMTALMVASSGGNHKVVRLLLDRGADVAVQDNNGATALMMASTEEVVNLLMIHGAKA